MDTLEPYARQASRIDAATAAAAVDALPRRSFLFLQGPISNFFDRLARALIARGHRVHRVNFHFGDRIFWHLPATNYRGRFPEWRAFVAELLEKHQVTDLVLHGDRRPYHVVAAEEARARGIPVLATDLGYVRPDWLTLEYDGMTTYSRFPREPQAIRALAAKFPEPALEPRFKTPFWIIAVSDIAYNLGLVLGRPFYPNYRYHSVCHPFLEYVGWLKSRPAKLLTARATAAAKERLQQAPGTYFLVPLQLATDYQLRAHSPYDDLREAIEAIVASFARSGSRRTLAFIVHPLDNGLIDWHHVVARLARQHDVADRVIALHGGTPTDLVRKAAGVVTINSTVGLAALWMEVPVKALGNAIFDIEGLSCQAPLDEFWLDPRRPEPALLTAFLRALIGTTQVKGGYYERRSQDCAIAGFVDRLEQRPYPLPPLDARRWPECAPRPAVRTVAVTGASGSLGAALARAFAMPGVRLCLAGASAGLAPTAEDCRNRGALVDIVRDIASIATAAIDTLVVADEATDHPDAAIVKAMAAVAAATETMRQRGSGNIVFVGQDAVQPSRDPRAARARHAYVRGLQRRLRGTGVTVSCVHPGAMASAGATLLRTRALAAANADRIADATLRGLRRGARRNIRALDAAAVFSRAARLLAVRTRDGLSSGAREANDVAPEEAPLFSETGSGN